MMKKTIIYVSMVLNISVAYSNEPSIEELEKLEALNEAISTLDEIQIQFERESRKRKMDCIKSFGHVKFCECLNSNLPVAWSFSEYVAIVTNSKEENNYSKMPKDYQEAYDAVPNVREECVKGINEKP